MRQGGDPPVRGVVELSVEMGMEAVRRIAHSAYETSRHGTVVLLLNGISIQSMNELLDPLVRRAHLGLGNVRFLEIEGDAEALSECLAEAEFILAASSELESVLIEGGFDYSSPDDALSFLEEAAGSETLPLPRLILSVPV